MREAGGQSDQAIRKLRREMAKVSDPQVLRIVAAVEEAADRGSADDLIAPLRRRLMILRPPRRLRFTRLLFYPLTPLIVPPWRWRPVEPGVPRSVVGIFADYVRSGIGGATAEIEAEIAGCSTADSAIIDRVGRRLWPMAARVLISGDPPASWKDTGLSIAEWQRMARIAAALLGQAAALEDICQASGSLLPPPAEAIHAIVRNVASVSEAALPMMISLMLLRLPDVAKVLVRPKFGKNPAVVSGALDQAAWILIEHLDDAGPEPWIGPGTLIEAGAAARRLVSLLAQLATVESGPARVAACARLRARLDEACKARFQAGLENDLLAPLRAVAPLSPQAVEAAARGLRVLETEARVAGNGRFYEALLADAAAVVRSDAVAERLDRAGQIRLVEILLGPDAALEMLAHGG